MDNITIYSKENKMPKPLFDEFFALMEEAFPKSERRDYNGFKDEYNSPRFRSMCYYPGYLAGVLNFWDFDDFVYVEHFAVSPKLRGRGTGSALINEIKKQACGRTLILEAEPPQDSDIAKRRIAFYERLDFVLNSYEYIQPSLIEGEMPIPLVIMSLPFALSKEQYSKITETLYREVYNIRKI